MYTGKLQHQTSKYWPSSGFTLIEMLIVIVIAAILFTYATLSIRGHNPEDKIHTEAQRLDQLIQLALEQAILRGEEYALEVHINSYRFLRQQRGKWIEVKNDRILRQRQLPKDMQMELSLEDTTIVISPATGADSFSLKDKTSNKNNNSRDKLHPQIYLLASGEITPEFSIRLSYPGVKTSYLIKGRFDGQLKSSRSHGI